VAWLATTGTVTMDLNATETYRDYLEYLKQVADDDALEPRARLLEILRGGTNTLFEAERGEIYTWPLRFTAVLLRRLVDGEQRWLFHQVQFAFATTRYPDVRNL
jgi:hypothetical protein